ncbi:uncharacterized protein LOC111997893 isoform X5 [Quercus suber]|uniref:uncharacterized protein LOC111997893 isoform X5 n=1 Tax=Quercus suber TaxID=58331 RepID=UPI0032DFF24F
MAEAIHNLAVILKNHPQPQNDAEFLLVKQTRPPKFDEEEYDSYVDSDLWDLPSTQLNLLGGNSESPIVVEGAQSINLTNFDLHSALTKVLEQVGFEVTDGGEWKFWKYVEEAEFGPGPPVHTVFIMGKLLAGDRNLQAERCKWMSVQSCLSWLLEVKPSSDRVGPLTVVGLVNDSIQPADQKVPSILRHQLQKIVAALPRKLVVFVTHHHRDHVDGLSIVQKCNPNATLLVHENTMRRIGKGDWSLGYTSVSGAEDICIGGQRLRVIFAPGHTDGHMALLHMSTHSLIVGDHCVGQGSAVLDITSGGNMTQYFQTTYKFMELSPHTLIPMHGRVNLWPKHMLCGYLKNRRSRETSILKAIENGAETLFDIVAEVYSELDRSVWIPAASNVRLHVEHLAEQDKLPKAFSIQKFQKTCGLYFLARWIWAYLSKGLQLNYQKLWTSTLFVFGAVASFAVLYSVNKFSAK